MELKESRKEEGKVYVPLRMLQDRHELLNGHSHCDGCNACWDDGSISSRVQSIRYLGYVTCEVG
jgi:hypothetical protein